jgi:hypothetical protein
MTILREEHAESIGGVLHCFSGDPWLAQEALDLVTNGLAPPNQVQFTVNYTLAGGQVFNQVFTVDANGQNFFGIQAGDGAVINSVTVQALGNTTFGDISQWRVGGFANPQTEVPEPATLLLLGTGLAGTASALRRRFNKNRSNQ